MNALAITALVLVCAWLGILTFVVVLLVRQIGLLTVRLSVTGGASSLDDDGPEVGSSVPEAVASVMPDGAEEHAFLLLVSSTCTPCWEMVADLGEHRFEQKIVALVPGREEQAGDLAALLPSSMRVVLDPEASRLAGALQLESTPFVLEVEYGTVTRKAYLYEGASDLVAFVESRNGVAKEKSVVEIVHKEEIEER
ncbi:MAG: hypothetical protein ACRDTR_02420 [Rubrobacter sp.]